MFKAPLKSGGVLRGIFADLNGKPLWTAEPCDFTARIGESIVHDGTGYMVRRSAVCEGKLYVNLEVTQRIATTVPHEDV
jgi:hypothetical protein